MMPRLTISLFSILVLQLVKIMDDRVGDEREMKGVTCLLDRVKEPTPGVDTSRNVARSFL